jgi:predicted  nucleic acid-binding Zn-ribbon protein
MEVFSSYNKFMDEDMLNDLKQFIANTVSQTEVRLTGRLDGIEQRMGGLEQKVEDLDLKVDTISEVLHENLSDHELRLTKLEQRAA